jgi:hypothetical protein
MPDATRTADDQVRPSSEGIEALQRYRRAVDYLAVAQIYLQDNCLLEQPLRADHIKPRLLGHWGTCPGLNAVHAGLNRLIRDTDSAMLLLTGPGHGAPAGLANLWLEGSLDPVLPHLGRDRSGLWNLVRGFSWPGGQPSHLVPDLPGVIHEGGELGYALSKAFGAAFDNPELIVACVVNGYKISNPTVFGTMSEDELSALFSGYGWRPRRDPRHPGRCPLRRATSPPPVADDPAAVPEGAGSTARDRRSSGGRLVPVASGAGRQRPTQRRAPARPRGLAPVVPARGTLRRSGRSRSGCRRSTTMP